MGTIVERIGVYAASLRPEHLDAAVTDYAKRILLDTLACGYGGLESEPARIVRRGIAELGERGLIETVTLVGHYTMIGGILNSFDVEPPEGARTF